ncbi:uncharacterized protein Z518_05361 [Rhinocladiella mackenziei CBS 650.93]|uniref:Major facilitator superfamily (MFS) profile domain-containing protein n=1 Tax=Rhinocladiella mackenziei CBS 650.93 TaxID=1442369 RepID=A0A0D2IN01_9EURO|nr:uncharacterized protein Z518_05361 [Rhinocladiella mackenziei CBS 650.93]KIX04491.1 hypothetical protein Z518_05361 [Rhinocladiella mackenziei CBS 650.93]
MSTTVDQPSKASMAAHEIEHTDVDHNPHHQHRQNNISALDLEDDPHRAALEDNPDKAEIPSWSTLLAVLFLGLSFVAPVSIGFTMTASVIVPIGTALGDVTNITWIVGSWSVASSVFFSLAGSLSDVFGRRWLIIAGNGVNLVGAIAGATAQSVEAVIGGMTLLGAGCGLIFVAYAGIPELLPNKWRGIGLGFTEFCILLPFAGLAVLLGNLLTANASWRWIFYLAIIYSGVSLVGVTAFYFPPSRPQADYEKSRWQEVRELDYIGITLYTGGLTTLLIGLTWAGTTAHPWASVSVIAPIVIGVVTLAACFVYDFFVPKNPFFPLRLFRQVREFTLLLSFVFVAGMVYFTMAALLPLGALYMITKDPVEIGVISIPGGLSQVLGGFVIPALVHKFKHIKIQILVALVIQTAFTACYSTVIPTNKAGWMALQFFAQACFPCVTVLCYVTAGLHVRQRDLGIASGLIGTFRSAGGSVGNAVFNTILNSYISSRLGPSIAAAAVAAGYPSDGLDQLIPAVIATGSGVPEQFVGLNPPVSAAVQAASAEAFRDTYAYGFRRMFWCTIPFGAVAVFAACWIKDPSRYLTNHVAVHMEREVVGGTSTSVATKGSVAMSVNTPSEGEKNVEV